MLNKRLIFVLIAFLFLALNVNALILNPDFENTNSNTYPDTNADNWTVLIPTTEYTVFYDENGACGNDAGLTNWALPTDAGVWSNALIGSPKAPASGSWDFMVGGLASSKKVLVVSDWDITTLNQDTNFCFSFGQSSLNQYGWFYGIYKSDGSYCNIESVGYPSNSAWVETCRTLPAGVYNGKLAIYFGRVVGAGTYYVFMDAGSSGANLTVDILNHSPTTAYADSTVVFKTKLVRTDLNQYITDANMQFYSSDFNGTMTYNSSTGYYELSHTFPAGQLGAYDFNVLALSTGDANYLNNLESFSITFIKESNFIVPLTNTLKTAEYQTGATSYVGELKPSTESNEMIFYFNGDDTNIFGSSIDLNIIVINTDLSGKRYSVYTANEDEFDLNTWNFDSTITFGSTINGGVQKIWIDQNEFYEHAFIDSSLLSNEIKYYRLVYDYPYKYWDTLDPDQQSEWDIQYIPSVFESEAGHKRDYYAVSQFNNVRNEMKNPLPDINSNQTYSKYLLAFNTQADPAATIQAGSDLGDNIDSTTAVSSSGTETTFHVNTGYQFPLIKADSTSFVQLMLSDYALIERGFFLEPLTLLNKDYSPVEKVLVSGSPAKVIREGEEFRIETSLYNREGKLDYLEGKVYFGSVDPSNQAAYFKKDLNFLGADEVYNLDWLVDGIVDLNGTSARDFVVVLKATTTTGDWFEIQTDTFKLRQFPSYPDEFNLNFYITNKKVGEHLRGVVSINTEAPEALRGLNLRLWKPDSQSIESPDYNITLWKDSDFTCTGFQCQFDFEFIDHVLDSQAIWALNISALLTTQLEDTNNFLTAKTLRFSVYYIDFNEFRLMETIERPNHDYRHNEPIPLTLVLIPSDKQPTKNELKIVLRAANCSTDATGGTCTDIDINYAPDSYVYDSSTGLNYYFWRQIYVDSDLSLFDDADYYRFYAIVESISGKISQPIKPLLAAKCQTYSSTDFYANMLNIGFQTITGYALNGCTVYTDSNVSIDNNGMESRILIDRDKITTKPNLECSFCINPDQNNNYVDNLKQDLICGAYYTFNESAIDKFDFYLTNKNSDLSVDEDDPDAQYVKGTMPFSLLALNDLTLMKQSLTAEYGTQATDIGGLIQQGINHLFTGFANPVSDYTEKAMNGLLTDAAYDCNFTAPLDSTYIGGMVFFKLNGINTLNQQDFVYDHPEVSEIQTNQLLKYLNYEGISYSVKPTTIDMYGSDMTKLLSTTDSSPLVINEEFDESEYKLQTAGDTNQQFKTLPTKLYFNTIIDMFYDDETTVKRMFVPITITAVLSPRGLNLSKIWSDLTYDPVQTIVKNWIVIVVIMVLLLWAANVRYKWVKAGGGEG